jgi:hypothetical protein
MVSPSCCWTPSSTSFIEKKSAKHSYPPLHVDMPPIQVDSILPQVSFGLEWMNQFPKSVEVTYVSSWSHKFPSQVSCHFIASRHCAILFKLPTFWDDDTPHSTPSSKCTIMHHERRSGVGHASCSLCFNFRPEDTVVPLCGCADSRVLYGIICDSHYPFLLFVRSRIIHNKELFPNTFLTAHSVDPCVWIRTSGEELESATSSLWQLAYTAGQSWIRRRLPHSDSLLCEGTAAKVWKM